MCPRYWWSAGVKCKMRSKDAAKKCYGRLQHQLPSEVIKLTSIENDYCKETRVTKPSKSYQVYYIAFLFSWFVEHHGKCSARCGPGYQTQSVRCIRINSDRREVVLEKHCPVSTKPPEVIACTGTCEGSKWIYSDWSKVLMIYLRYEFYELELVGAPKAKKIE